MKQTNYQIFDFLDFDTEWNFFGRSWKPLEIKEEKTNELIIATNSLIINC